jgi:hypothetical protein
MWLLVAFPTKYGIAKKVIKNFILQLNFIKCKKIIKLIFKINKKTINK